ncbi:hypothetical protein Dimus_005516 [Dionaea muscipula]
MLGDSSSLFGSTGDDGGAASGAALAHEGGGGGAAAVGGGSSSIAIAAAAAAVIGEDDRGRIDEFGERGSAGNRWPRQETLALLKIRSDMDVIFRDSSLKGPLWEEENGGAWVSSKRQEVQREIRERLQVPQEDQRRQSRQIRRQNLSVLRSIGGFREQPSSSATGSPRSSSSSSASPGGAPGVRRYASRHSGGNTRQQCSSSIDNDNDNDSSRSSSIQRLRRTTTQPSKSYSFAATATATAADPIAKSTVSAAFDASPVILGSRPYPELSFVNAFVLVLHLLGRADLGEGKRKRKWKDFFERLMKEVIDKQEELQKKFLEAIEKREHDRLAREEAWKVQEMARLNREHEILVQERSMAAAKDAALIAFLQKISEQQQIPLPLQFVQPQSNSNIARRSSSANPAPVPAPMIPRSQPQPQPQAPPQVEETAAMAVPKPSQTALPPPQQLALTANVDPLKRTNGENSPLPPSPSRWPKAEVQALIDLRTNMDQKYQESGPKGPLWEEISASMRRLGYNRSAKRCKEKWENINKYFKKVKESNKKRPEDSKTCPYFHQLDAIYREKSIRIDNPFNNPATYALKSAEGGPVAAGTPIMARPEQQWPLPEDPGSHNGPDDSDGDLDDDDDDQAYEFVANSNAAVVGTAAAGEEKAA